MELLYNEYSVPIWVDRNIAEMNCANGCTTM